MSGCQFWSGGRCLVAEEQSRKATGKSVKCPVGEDACRVCLRESRTSQSGEPNRVTTSMAIRAQSAPEAAERVLALYGHLRKGPGENKSAEPRPRGVGWELAGMLKSGLWRWLGVERCSRCDKRAKKMDRRGVEWCRRNEDLILDWLADSAREQGLPFAREPARLLLVRRAIRRVERRERRERKEREQRDGEDELMDQCKCDGAGACPWRRKIVTEADRKACREGRPPAPDPEAPCVQMREAVGGGVYRCALHGRCTPGPNTDRIASCSTCPDRLPVDAAPELIERRWVDPLRIYDRRRSETTALRGLLAGRGAFLVLGGPSLTDDLLPLIERRGVFSLGVNNVAGRVRCSAFVCSDPPSKFSDGIWRDPTVTKLVPVPKLKPKRGRLRRKLPGGEFERIELTADQCPNVWGFERRSWLAPDVSWFVRDGAAWGNHNAGCQRTGEPKAVGTMLLGLRLLQYLGARRIFLVGCDFDMRGGYSFPQGRDEGAISSNNAQYRVLARWLELLRPVWERWGFETYNCNPHSRLRAFDHVPIEAASELCRGEDFPAEPFDLAGWYEK